MKSQWKIQAKANQEFNEKKTIKWTKIIIINLNYKLVNLMEFLMTACNVWAMWNWDSFNKLSKKQFQTVFFFHNLQFQTCFQLLLFRYFLETLFVNGFSSDFFPSTILYHSVIVGYILCRVLSERKTKNINLDKPFIVFKRLNLIKMLFLFTHSMQLIDRLLLIGIKKVPNV